MEPWTRLTMDIIIESAMEIFHKTQSLHFITNKTGHILLRILHNGTDDAILSRSQYHMSLMHSLIARFMGPTWGPSGADRTQVGPMLAPITLLSGNYHVKDITLITPCQGITRWVKVIKHIVDVITYLANVITHLVTSVMYMKLQLHFFKSDLGIADEELSWWIRARLQCLQYLSNGDRYQSLAISCHSHHCLVQGWGLLSQSPPFRYIPNFSA